MSFRTEIGLALLLLAALTAAVLLGGPRPGADRRDARSSTLVSGPSGSQALYDVLIRLGQPVERRRTALFTLMDDSARRPLPRTLVVVAPPQSLYPAEVDQVVEFVLSGRSVVAVGNAGGITRCTGWEAPPVEDRPLPDSVPVVPPPGLTLPPVRRVLQRLDEADDKSVVQEAQSCGDLIPARADTLLRLADGRPVIVRLRYPDGGQVVLAADPGYFRNRAWRESDAPRLLIPLLLAGPRGRVAWDEYHQGFGEQVKLTGLLFNWMLRSPLGWALLQLTAVALVWLAVTAVRFGPAQAVIERRRRSPLEHVEALAAGLESGGGADLGVGLSIGGLWRRLHRGARPPSSAVEERRWLQSLELSLATPRGRAAVRTLQHLSTHPGGDERVLAAARAVEDVWEELRPRTTRD